MLLLLSPLTIALFAFWAASPRIGGGGGGGAWGGGGGGGEEYELYQSV